MNSNDQSTEKRENFSRKRSAILRALQSTDCHPTADWVYAKLKPKYPNLSLGTVYRNLKKFCESGRAISVGVINGQEHFDGNVEPHSHMVCEKCGDVLDIPQAFFNEEQLEGLSKVYGHQMTEAEVVFKGLCKECCHTQEKSEMTA